MKTRILGAYKFNSKSGKELVNFSCSDERTNGYGTCTLNIMTSSENVPCDIADMINKDFVIDCRYGSNGSIFAQSFYPIK